MLAFHIVCCPCNLCDVVDILPEMVACFCYRALISSWVMCAKVLFKFHNICIK
jgi:hypothetical protein